MKKIGIISNLEERDGPADHARYLQYELSVWQDYSLFLTDDWNRMTNWSPNVAIINWHEQRVIPSVDRLSRLKERGAKIVLIFHNTQGQDTEIPGHEFLNLVDEFVTHEPITGNGKPTTCIPVPVWDLKLPKADGPMIGTAGFPFKWKRPDVVADTAIKLGVKCRLIAPPYPVPEAQGMVANVAELQSRLGSLSDVRQNWMSVEEVVRLLAECTLNIFWFESQDEGDLKGQSGAVRLGISAKRPTIISRHRKFRTLEPYADEFYVADTIEQVVAFASEILANPEAARKPNRIVQETGWPAAARKHREIIERLCA